MREQRERIQRSQREIKDRKDPDTEYIERQRGRE